MAINCHKCGEELIGAVNRCWKCGSKYEKIERSNRPPICRPPVLAAYLQADVDAITSVIDADILEPEIIEQDEATQNAEEEVVVEEVETASELPQNQPWESAKEWFVTPAGQFTANTIAIAVLYLLVWVAWPFAIISMLVVAWSIRNIHHRQTTKTLIAFIMANILLAESVLKLIMVITLWQTGNTFSSYVLGS